MTDFEKFANHDRNISSMTLYRYGSVLDAYINPSIIEDRKLNIAAMDVFSHLMMDRIIFLGVGTDTDVANIVQAQLLYLASVDDKADISFYLNMPGGVVSAGLGIYDTMQLVKPDIATICTGMALRYLWAGEPCRRPVRRPPSPRRDAPEVPVGRGAVPKHSRRSILRQLETGCGTFLGGGSFDILSCSPRGSVD